MEIEKKRETSWKIQLKSDNEDIELTSIEISGEVRFIKFALSDNEKVVKVKMNKEEFYNFLSLLSAFKDVVIGEESIIIEDNLNLSEIKPQKEQENSVIFQDLYNMNSEPQEKSNKKNNTEELNPEEWDPW